MKKSNTASRQTETILNELKLFASRLAGLLKPGQKRVAQFACLFIIAFLVFFAVFYIKNRINNVVNEIFYQATQKGWEFDAISSSGLIPEFYISHAKYNARGMVFSLDDIRISFSVIGIVDADANFAGGKAKARISLPFSANARPKKIEITLEDAMLEELAKIYGDIQYVTSIAGKCSAQIMYEPAYDRNRPDRNRATGEMVLRLENGKINHYYPLLKKNRIDNIGLVARAIMENGTIRIESCELMADEIVFNANGLFVLAGEIANTRLDLRSVLAVPPELLHEGFMPVKSMAEFRKRGSVHLQISQTLFNPRISLMDQ